MQASVTMLQSADALIIVAPVYLDLPPYKTLSWLHALVEQCQALHACTPSVYAICHSGYFEPIHKQASLHAIGHFCRRMEWPWQGGLNFGGTPPIDGKPLEKAKPFTWRIRPALDELATLVSSGRVFRSGLVARAQRKPMPLPRRLSVWMVNRMIRQSR